MRRVGHRKAHFTWMYNHQSVSFLDISFFKSWISLLIVMNYNNFAMHGNKNISMWNCVGFSHQNMKIAWGVNSSNTHQIKLCVVLVQLVKYLTHKMEQLIEKSWSWAVPSSSHLPFRTNNWGRLPFRKYEVNFCIQQHWGKLMFMTFL